MENAREILASNLNYLIKNRGITPKELAERTKVTKMSVSNWIQGKNSPDIETLAKICEIYGVTFSDLFYSDMETGTKKAPVEDGDQREAKYKSIQSKLALMSDEQVERMSYVTDLINCPNEDFELIRSIANVILNRTKSQ